MAEGTAGAMAAAMAAAMHPGIEGGILEVVILEDIIAMAL